MTAEPLAGLRVVVTRRAEDAPELVRALAGRGVDVTCVPLIRFAPPDDPAPLAAARAAVARYDLLVLTSQQAVRAFLDGLAPPARPPRVVAVGRSTARAIGAHGWPVDVAGPGEGGAALAAAIQAQVAVAGARVLYPLSSLARSSLPALLRQAGAIVDEVVAYQTLPPALADAGALWPLLDDAAVVWVFASPSAVQHLDAIARDRGAAVAWARLRCASIGPTTSQALRQLGARAIAEAPQPDDAGLLDAIARAGRAATEDSP